MKSFNPVAQGHVERKQPSGDKQFASYVSAPQLGTLLPGLFPGVFPNPAAFNATNTPGGPPGDPLDRIPSTVVPGFAGNYTGPTQADMFRLNMTIPPTSPTSSAISASSAGTSQALRMVAASRTMWRRLSCAPSPAQHFHWWTWVTSPTQQQAGSPWG